MTPEGDHTSRDALYAKPRKGIADFCFDDAVAQVFPDMIRRSVPGYATIIAMIGVLAEQYVQPGSSCYDLGCSLGAATQSMRRRLPQVQCRIIAVDNSIAMIEGARRLIDAQSVGPPVHLVCSDILDVRIRSASVVVLNFTLQFIHPEDRLGLIGAIHAGLVPGGILILSEKIRFDDQNRQQLYTDLHHAFKRANGYSDLEISQKRTALEHVLIPETLDQHQDRLRQAGFRNSTVWFQCCNFISLVAQK